MAEYSGMNNGVPAVLDIRATDLVIVGDSRLAIQQSLGVIATQLNRHRELVARLQSVKYLHAVREYNASAESLATEALENKASSVISDELRLAELRSLNRIQEVIYAPITESLADEPSVSIAQAQVQTRHLRHMRPSWRSVTVPEPSRKQFFDFGPRDLTVTTRLQAKSKPKHVRFADETSVTGGEDVTQREEDNGVPTEDSVRLEVEFSRVTAPNRNTPRRLTRKSWTPTRKKNRDCKGRGVAVGEFEDSSPRGRIYPNVPFSERRVENVRSLRPKRGQCALLRGNEASEK
ncbi:LOW QUALITY PROTEIN: hypothetical protein PHMEG_00033024 [Phytophthora megakarya]|uniref:RNase H type-1 domain-containing protein n=1 Tax=Phytophthora megakarya TaxID=4795 RepID=A0A225UUV9_9STRA|nr:LOW QUALITY PROTEIN: hypothetical protein PHMEG_00033024 [Phytophthora megakarya]